MSVNEVGEIEMKCECGTKLSIYNKDGVCNGCITENRFVTVRFVFSGGIIYPCWSYSDYEKCLNNFPKNAEYKVHKIRCRANRVVNIQRLIRGYEKRGIDVEGLLRDLFDLFLVDAMEVFQKDSVSCSKVIESLCNH